MVLSEKRPAHPKRRLVIFSINSITAIPVFNLILKKIRRDLIEDIIMGECFVNNLSTRFEFPYRHIEILKFDSARSFNSQKAYHKFRKYLHAVFFLLRYLRKGDIFYTCDVEIAAFAVAIRKLKFAKCNIVYHQFETIESDKANFAKRIAISMLKKTGGIDLAIFPEKNRAEYFQRLLDNDSLDTLIFPNTCDSKPADGTLDHSASEKITIGHIGSLSTNAFYLEELLRTAKELPESDYDFLFVGVPQGEIRNLIIRYLPHATITGWVRHHELPALYEKIDLGLILYRPLDFNTDYCAPNKLYEYWSYGIPVLAPQLNGLLPLFDHQSKGLLVDFERRHELEEGFKICRQSILRQSKRDLIRLFESTMSLSLMMKKLEHKIERLYRWEESA